MLPCPSCQASNEAAAARCSDCGAALSASKLSASMLRPRLRAFPLLVTALVCATAGLGAASFAFRSQPIPLEPEPAADESMSYPTAPERTWSAVQEALTLADGQRRDYALSIGTHIIRVRSQPEGVMLELGEGADCTSPLAGPARTWLETRCTLRTRSFLTVTNAASPKASVGASEQVSIELATLLEP